ncbi:hypothetical protein GCM10023261_05630 [Bartonella jaculi]|uniref:Uncharacterized protein n=1 Tax=Bartonella jaculi TaxID=686226 RepID=A0ABP9N0T5_9HYPH
MALMNRLNARSVATLGAGKYNDGAGLLLHKRIPLCNKGKFEWIKNYVETPITSLLKVLYF